MNYLRALLIIVLISIIYLTFTVNSAYVLEESNELINAYRNNNLIRLHVIANSDSVLDQYVKRKVRDGIIAYMAENESLLVLDELFLQEIKKRAEKLINEEGLSHKVNIELGNFNFPMRTYNDLTLPAGNYRALKLIIGRGNGANWWCVLSPPLCFETKQINLENKVKLKLKVVELLKSKFKKFNWARKLID